MTRDADDAFDPHGDAGWYRGCAAQVAVAVGQLMNIALPAVQRARRELGAEVLAAKLVHELLPERGPPCSSSTARAFSALLVGRWRSPQLPG